MKTVKPVSQETYERIGAAYAICSKYPDIFGDVTFRKFCGMFVDDIVDEGEDLIEARKKAYAGEMYDLLATMWADWDENGGGDGYQSTIGDLLDRIDRKECASDE